MARRKSQSQRQNSTSKDSSKLTFLEHLYELRKRLFWVVLTLVFTTAIGLEIKDQLIEVVMAPLKGGKLIYLTPGGGFNFIFTLSLYFGLLLTIPVITYQIYRFLQPMLVEPSRKFITSYITVSSLLAASGAALAYFLAIPGALGFLNGVAGSSIVPNLTADSYLQFVVTYMVGLAALFQLPLLLFLIDHIKPIPPGKLAKSQRYGIVLTTVLAGFITPSPDLMNYSIVLFPMLGAYEFGVLAVWIRRKYFRHPGKVVKNRKEYHHEENANAEVAEEPLTAIVEEMAEENAAVEQQPTTAEQEPLQVEPKVVATETNTEPVPEPVIEPEPIIESTPVEMPTSVEQQPVPAAPTPVQYDPHQAAAAYYAQQLAYQQQLYAYQHAYAQQQVALAQQQPIQPVQQVPQSKRSIDGVQRVAQRYKTNVHVPARGHVSEAAGTSPQAGEESSDGLLTAQA